MSKTEKTTEDQSVALYWDFENLHASLVDGQDEGAYGRQENRLRPQDPMVDVQAVVDFAATFGRISVNRAYCNWQFFGRYRDSLLQSSVELIQLFPPGGASKNGADIKLCLDAMEDIGRFSHIGTVIVVGGDSDFMPLAQKVKAAGRTLVGLADRRATNRYWAKSCNEFRYYENLVGVQTRAGDRELALAMPQLLKTLQEASDAQTTELFIRSLELLAEASGESWVNKALVGQMIKRLDPTFDPKDHGFENFRALIKAYSPILEVRDGEHDQLLRFNEDYCLWSSKSKGAKTPKA